LGLELQIRGDLSGARVELEAAVRHGPSSPQTSTTYFGFDGYNIAGVALARTLWLQGHAAKAVERARQAIKDAASLGHPVTLSVVLIWAISVFLWAGDLLSAEEHIDWFISRAESYSLGPYLAVGRGFRGQLAIRRGNAEGGVESLQGCLAELHVARYEQMTTLFNISLVQGLAAMGRFADGFTLIDEAIRRVEARGELCYLPELLRVKGGLLLSMPQPRGDDAERCFMRSLELSRRQGARAWALRAAVDLAELWASQGRPAKAREVLQPVFDQFTESSDVTELKAAGRLMASLG
jgi:tetratricopeptide (TPR) repeat protein